MAGSREPGRSDPSADTLACNRSVATWGLVLSVAIVLQVTMYPFTFDFSGAQLIAGLQIASFVPFAPLPGHGLSRSEMLANVILFVPVGFFVAVRFSAAAKSARSRWLVAAAGLLLSLVVESLQLFVPRRVPATTDVLCNGLGGLAGAVAAWRWGGHRFLSACRAMQARVEGEPLLAAVFLLAMGVVASATLPWEFAVTFRSVRKHLAAAEWAWPVQGSLELRAGAALVCLRWGWLLALWGAMAAAWKPRQAHALLLISTGGALLSLTAFLAQVFVPFRTLTLAEPVAGWLGATAGAAAALTMARRSGSAHRLAKALFAAYVTYLVIDALTWAAPALVQSGLATADGQVGVGELPARFGPPAVGARVSGFARWAPPLARMAPFGIALALVGTRGRSWLIVLLSVVLAVVGLLRVAGAEPASSVAALVAVSMIGVGAGWYAARRLTGPGAPRAWRTLAQLGTRDPHPPTADPATRLPSG